MYSLHFLKRAFVGERLHRDHPLLDRAAQREEIRPPTITLPDHARPEWFGVRRSTVRVEPRPNAPQLIRLVRHPFSLSGVAFQKQPLVVLSLARPARETVASMVDAARQREARVPLPRPMEEHPQRERRQRPAVADWLASMHGQERTP